MVKSYFHACDVKKIILNFDFEIKSVCLVWLNMDAFNEKFGSSRGN